MTGKKRSEKRKRTVLRPARFTPEEAANFDAKAAPYGGASAYIRHIALGVPLPPRATDRAQIVQLRTEFAKLRAEMGKIGSNINQIAYRYNISEGRPAGNIEGALMTALEEWSAAVRTLDELRLVGLQALGFERKRKPKDK
jgi:Bacterial mobilisation protein (MobC)